MGVIAACNSAESPRSGTILVVEDDVLVRLSVAEALRDGGHAVVEAANADEALAVLASPTPLALIVTDVNMPGSMDGVALARHVRSTRPELKVIVVSGRVDPASATDAADAFLGKPYEPAIILRTIDALLSGRSG
jgi:CheY-like chemotaxis protein